MMKLLMVVVILALLAVGIMFFAPAPKNTPKPASGGDAQSQPGQAEGQQQTGQQQSQSQEQPAPQPEEYQYSWLADVKGIGLAYKDIKTLQARLRTDKHNLAFQAMDLKSTLKGADVAKYRGKSRVPYQMAIIFFKGSLNAAKIQPTYEGNGYFAIVDTKSKRVVTRHSAPLKKLCPT